MNKINIGLIGLGAWGKNYLRIFNELPRSKVILVCDKKLTKIKNKNYTNNSSELFKSKEIDAIVIATEATSHYELAKKALLNNKHVLVEKPLTDNYKTANELVKLSKVKNKILMVGHTFLYNRAIQKIKKYINNNKLGKIYYINCRRTHLGPVRKDVNVIWDLATHDLSIINFLLDQRPKNFFAVGGKHISNNIDVSYINLFYKNKIIGNIHVSWEDSNKSRTVEIVGSKARIIFDDLNFLEPIKIFNKGIGIDTNFSNFGESQFKLRDGNILSPKILLNEPLKEMSNNFLESIILNKNPLSDGVFSANLIKTLEEINKKIKII